MTLHPSSVGSPALALASRVASYYSAIATVEAVAISGSRTSSLGDSKSDIDFYIYSREPIALETRTLAAAGARRAEIGNEFWEPGDEWVDGVTGISADIMFRGTRGIEEQLDRVLKFHQASIGYTTCFWYNVLHSDPLFDRTGWFRALQERAREPYPSELQIAIIRKNYPILRRNMSSYIHQMELAIRRGDPVSLNHRVTALLASYFDIVFAVNREPHPGEKRLLQFVPKLCAKVPLDFSRGIEELLASLRAMDGSVIQKANAVIDGLDGLLAAEGMTLL
jgi:hypothetical protein